MANSEYLLDVNVLIALLLEHHVHHQRVTAWFNTPGLRWIICPFTEAGLLRYATAPRPGQVTLAAATATLDDLAQHPGFRFLPITHDWRTLTKPFAPRLYGSKQVTDAYLLGLAIHEHLVLVTMNKGIVHLAGNEHRQHLLLLEEKA